MSLGARESEGNTAEEFEILVCPICGETAFIDAVLRPFLRAQRCLACGLLFQNPQPSDETLVSIYNAGYALSADPQGDNPGRAGPKRATAQLYLDLLEQYGGIASGTLLDVGCGSGDLLMEAQQRGFQVTGIEYSKYAASLARTRTGARVICDQIDTPELTPGNFDVCVLSDVLEHVRDPHAFLLAVHRLLKPDGILFVATPSLDSWSARLLGKYWMEFKPEHTYYFDRASIQNLLFMTYFDRVVVQPNVKVLSLRRVVMHFERYPAPALTSLIRLAAAILPNYVLDREFKIVASGCTAIAQKQGVAARRKLSIVMPIFNELSTFELLMEQVLRKEIEDLDIEIIVVESNSVDGTRQAALKYRDHPRVKLVLEDKPSGKGHAVRTGLSLATGDFILIQDGDLEYDINDYEELLQPLRMGRAAFVLGSRHGNGAWKMRHFTDQPFMAFLLNSGHIFFTTLLNVLYRQNMKDPFTMFKVFRRDCLFGLRFECNRFDFDYELVIKLLRKDYKPIEIPVSYRSRSFHEGKKVSMVRDPLTWFRALARFRVQSLNVMQHAREDNLAARSSSRCAVERS